MIRKYSTAKQGIFHFTAFSLFLLTILFLLFPLFYLFFFPLLSIGEKAVDVVFFSSRLFSVTIFTVGQALCSAFFATLIGTLLAYFCAKKKFFLSNFLLSLAAIPVSIPPLIIALSYVFFFGKQGVLNSLFTVVLFEPSTRLSSFLYSFYAVVIIHSFYNFPLALKTITTVWEHIDSSLEDAASLLTKSKLKRFFLVTFPEIFPSMLSSFLLIFLYCFFSFLIILLFGGIGLSTLEVELYQVSRFLGFSSESIKIAFIETFVAGLFTFLYFISRKLLHKSSIETEHIKEKTHIKSNELFLFLVLIFLVFFFLVFPLCSLLLKSIFNLSVDSNAFSVFEKLKSFFSLRLLDFFKLFTRYNTWSALFTTVVVGIITASISVMSAICINYFKFLAIIKQKSDSFFSILPFISLVISPVILGFSLKSVFKLSSNFSILVLCFAQSATAWTIASIQIQESFSKIPISIMKASLLLSKSSFDAFFRCILPQLKRGIKVAFAFCFAISAGDASLPLVLKIPQFENLSLMIFRLAGAYRFTESASISVILLILVCGAFYLSNINMEKK